MAALLTDDDRTFELQIEAIDTEVAAESRPLVKVFDAVSNAVILAAFVAFAVFCIASWITPGDNLESLVTFWINK